MLLLTLQATGNGRGGCWHRTARYPKGIKGRGLSAQQRKLKIRLPEGRGLQAESLASPQIDTAVWKRTISGCRLLDMTGIAQGALPIIHNQMIFLRVFQIMTGDAGNLVVPEDYPVGCQFFDRSEFPFFAGRWILLQDRVGGIQFTIRRTGRDLRSHHPVMADDAISRIPCIFDCKPMMLDLFGMQKPEPHTEENHAQQQAGYAICLSHGTTAFAHSRRMLQRATPTMKQF